MFKSRLEKVAILSSGVTLSTVIGLISTAILARLFSKNDLGTYRQTLLAYSCAAPLVTLGFQQALFYFLPNEKERSRGVLVENLVLLGAGGLLLTLFLSTGGNSLLARRFHNPNLAYLLLLFAPYPLLAQMSLGINGCLMAREKTEQLALFTIGSRFFMLLAMAAPCLLWPSPSTAVLGMLCGMAVSTSVSLALMFRACDTGDWRPTRPGLWRQAVFALPLGLAGLAGSLGDRVAQVLVSALCSPTDFAVYSVGAMEIPLIGTITGSIAAVVMVDYVKLYGEKRMPEIMGLIHRVMFKSGLVLMPAMVFLFCLAPDLMSLMFGREYKQSGQVFRIFLLLLPMRTLSFGAVLQATGNSRHILFQELLCLLLSASGGWCGIHLLGPIGGAIATVGASYLSVSVYYGFVLSRTLACPVRHLLPWSKIGSLVIFSSVGALGVALVLQLTPAWSALARFATSGVVYIAVTALVFHKLGWVNVPAMLRSACNVVGPVMNPTPARLAR
jgi:O-antigen/teichoic acid export membrane protein